eukprot:ANDGO_06329.mRNA.1 SET and MYND domain-containing protein DDB_G0292454
MVVSVQSTASRGRGVFTTEFVRKGSLIWGEQPFVSAVVDPTFACAGCMRVLQLSRSTCPACANQGPCGSGSLEGRLQADWKKYYGLQVPLSHETEAIARKRGRLFPVLAKNIAFHMIRDVLKDSKSKCDVQQGSPVGNGSTRLAGAWQAAPVSNLVYANLHEAQRTAFSADFARFYKDLFGKSETFLGKLEKRGLHNDLTSLFQEAKEAFTLDWYCRMMTTLNLNAVSVSYNVPIMQNGAANAVGRVRIGSALYAMTSYLNHSCNPSATLEFNPDLGSMVAVKATRDIDPDTEITIDYMDETQAHRPAFLEVNYGFVCQECTPQDKGQQCIREKGNR